MTFPYILYDDFMTDVAAAEFVIFKGVTTRSFFLILTLKPK